MMQGTMKQTFLDSHKLLMQPSNWIGDAAATMDMMTDGTGMVKKQMSKTSVSIVMKKLKN